MAHGPGDEGKEASQADDKPPSDEPGVREEREASEPKKSASHGSEHPYIASRAANRVGAMAGMEKVGTVSAVLSTLGLSLLRKRGRAAAGATLIATAAGLSLLKREDKA